jgi:hypothetical protein
MCSKWDNRGLLSKLRGLNNDAFKGNINNKTTRVVRTGFQILLVILVNTSTINTQGTAGLTVSAA